MLEKHRKPGEIPVVAGLARLLARLRAEAGVEQVAPEIDLTELRDVELAIGSRFGDDVLAVFAAHLPALELELEWRLALVVGHTGALHQQGGRGDLVALGHTDRETWWAVEIAGAGGGGGAGSRLVEIGERGAVRSQQPLAEWLRARFGGAPAGSASGAAATAGEASRFRPRLVARALESSAAGRRVRHATFGEGRVLTEIGTGPTRKVKAEFPGRGLVLLQARFLTFLDEQETP